MKKYSFVLVCVLVLSMSLVSTANAEIVIRHWQHHHEARTPILDSIAREFEARNPGVKIEFEPIPYDAYFDKLLTALASGTGPDVFQVSQEMGAEMSRSGALSPVPESVYSTEEIEDAFLQWTVSQFKYDGKYYGLPTDVQTLVMFVNDTMLQEAGLDPSNPPRTWSELHEQSLIIAKRDESGKLIQGGLDTRYKWAVYNLFLHQNIEGPIVDLDQKKVTYDQDSGIEAWNFVAELMTGPKAVDAATFLTGQMKFEQEKAAFYINHPVTRGRLELNHPDIKWSVHHVPVPDGSNLDEPTTVGHHWAYVANARSKNQEMAWLWIQHLTSEESQRKWVLQSRDLPSLIKLVNDPELTPDAEAKIAMDSLRFAKTFEGVGGNEVDLIRNEIWDNIVIGGMSVEQAVTEGALKETNLIRRKIK